MSSKYTEVFRINLAEYFIIDENGINKKILPQPSILFDSSAIVIVSKLDRKVYDFTGPNASEIKQEAATKLASNLGSKFNFEVEIIFFPAEKIPSDHIQFIEYFCDEYYLPKIDTTKALHYNCYFCANRLDRNSETCSSCGKEVIYCCVCNLPVSFKEKLGKCSLCGESAHLVHFQEWLKVLGMCPKCDKKLSPEGVIPITDENKDSFFK